MPIYEYHCKECDRSFEKLVRVNTPTEEIECPVCHKHTCEREMSVFSGLSSSGTSHSGGCGGGSGFT